MKDTLREFLGKKSIKKASIEEWRNYAKIKHPKELYLAIEEVFEDELNRVRKRDEIYETTRVRKTISFTNEEFQKVDAELKKSELDFSTFAKSILLKKKIVLPIERELIFELNKIGNNLNQLAKASNRYDDKIQILSQLVEIEKSIKLLR